MVECLHCTIIKEVGRCLESGEVTGKGAVDKLVLVMADILAMASIEQADEMMCTIIEHLSEAEAQARSKLSLSWPWLAQGTEDEVVIAQ
jgi:hypothetical protein